MEIRLHADISDEEWDAFCDASPEAWARHLSMSRRSALALDRKNIDLSFGITDNDTLVAVVPLVTQPLGASGSEFALSSGMPTPVPALAPGLAASEREAIFAACMAEVDRLALLHGTMRSSMAVYVFCTPAFHGTLKENPLLKFGYRDASNETLIIDLRKDETQLLRNMSKGHRADIVFARKQAYTTDFFDAKNITQAAWQAFTTLYKWAAGREVYSSERWAETLERVRSGFGLLAFIRNAGEETYFSGTLVTIYKGRAYYGMSATDPQYRRLRGIGQYLQWSIMGELKKRGFEFYDMGWQTGATEKEKAIASFKRHFGGVPTVVWAGIKTYRP